MNVKTVVGSVLGGLTLFAMGYLVYMIVLGDMNLRGLMGEPDIKWIIVGEIVFGYLITWTIGVTKATGIQGGAKAGAIMGVIVGLGINLILIGEGHSTDVTNSLIDIVVWGVRWGVAGLVVGWWMGRE